MSSTPNGTTWQDALNVITSTVKAIDVGASVELGKAEPQEMVTAANDFVGALTALSESPGMQTISKVSGVVGGLAELSTDIPALQSAITSSNTAEIALDTVKVVSDVCGTMAPLSTAAAAVADSNPTTIGELGLPLTAIASAVDTCAAGSSALVLAVESGQTILNGAPATNQWLEDADKVLQQSFIDQAIDYIISGSNVGVPGTDLIGNDDTLQWKTGSGAITTIGFNDVVDANEFAGKGGDPVGAGIIEYGSGTSVDVSGLVDSSFSVDTPNSTLSVETASSGSSVFANNNVDVTLNISGSYASDASYIEDVGTGSNIVLNISNDTLSSISAGSSITIDGATTLDKVEASGETISIGYDSDGVIEGTDNQVAAAGGDKLDDDGTGNVITVSNATVYVAAGDNVVVDGSYDKIVGSGSDHISDDGVNDNVYADNSSITFTGVSNGDIVHGDDDTGTDWGGYDKTGGSYGGYDGGYDDAVRARNLAAAQRSSGRDIGSITTAASFNSSASSSSFMNDENHVSAATDIANLAAMSRESAVLYDSKPKPTQLSTSVKAASASLVQSMSSWGPFTTSAFSAREIHSLQNEVLESNGPISSLTSITPGLVSRGPVAPR